MSKWIEEYQDAMRRTWFVGVVGTLVVLLAVVREVAKFFVALSANEVGLFNEVVRSELPAIALAIFIGLLAILRIALLLFSQQQRYHQATVTWILLTATLFGYIWLVLPSTAPPPGCTEGNICYGIYEMRDLTNFLAMAGVLFVPVSAVRLVATAVYARVKCHYI